MAKDSKITESEYVKLCNNINTQIDNCYKGLKCLHDNYTALLKGDGEGPFWNGSVASGFYKTAKANLDHDIEAYDAAVKAWEKLRDRYITLLRSGQFK